MTVRRLLQLQLLPKPMGRVVVYWLAILLVVSLLRYEPSPVVVHFQNPEYMKEQAFEIEQTAVQKKQQKWDRVSETRDSVDINYASVDELRSIRGIGPVLAKRIVTFRTEQGPFRSIDDLERVKGIGPKSLEKLKNQTVKVSR